MDDQLKETMQCLVDDNKLTNRIHSCKCSNMTVKSSHNALENLVLPDLSYRNVEHDIIQIIVTYC